MRLLTITLLLCTSVFAYDFTTTKISFQNSVDKLLKNISPANTLPGVVVASPSRANPDYFYHWVRDAALVMNAVFDLRENEADPGKKANYLRILKDYVGRVQGYQANSNFVQLGDAKYNVDGSLYNKPWGNPQHDGPALRAVTLIRLANSLLDAGDENYVRSQLYSNSLPANSTIKRDLEYVARTWNQYGFGYWEEVQGFHFSTAMGQRRALLMGAALARRLNDPFAASFYEVEAAKVSSLIERFWNNGKGYIESTIEQQGGFYKSQLDITSILGVHHGGNGDDFFAVSDPRVVRTALALESKFSQIYSINRNGAPGVAIGRYPEDTYNGYATGKIGNPWFLATFAMGEYYLRLDKDLKAGRIDRCRLTTLAQLFNTSTSEQDLSNVFRGKASAYLARAEYHAASNGSMSEQMNRESGFMQGAPDLTWSYASHITMMLQF